MAPAVVRTSGKINHHTYKRGTIKDKSSTKCKTNNSKTIIGMLALTNDEEQVIKQQNNQTTKHNNQAMKQRQNNNKKQHYKKNQGNNPLQKQIKDKGPNTVALRTSLHPGVDTRGVCDVRDVQIRLDHASEGVGELGNSKGVFCKFFFFFLRFFFLRFFIFFSTFFFVSFFLKGFSFCGIFFSLEFSLAMVIFGKGRLGTPMLLFPGCTYLGLICGEKSY